MYRIEVLTSGKYSNVALGSRFTFSKRKVKNFIEVLKEKECEYTITKLINCGGLWVWSKDNPVNDELEYEMIENIMKERG